MKLALASAVLFSVTTGTVRFDADGVRIGDRVVRGPSLRVESVDGARVLVSGSSVESLTSTLVLEAAPGRVLLIDPGVRVERIEGALRLTTHGNRALHFGWVGQVRLLPSPAVIRLGARGWETAQGVLDLEVACVLLQAQDDDPDTLIQRMLESAKKMAEVRAKATVKVTPPDIVKPPIITPPAKKVKKRRVFGEDPTLTGEATDSHTLRRLFDVSPSGS